MLVHVAVLHAIGEDNEGNTAVIARSKEALVQKVLAFANECYDDGSGDGAIAFEVEGDLYDTYEISWETHELDD
jgi:hypothetical protein